jgi:hypothetical protein
VRICRTSSRLQSAQAFSCKRSPALIEADKVEAILADVDSDRADGWWWICVTWDGLLVLLNPPANLRLGGRCTAGPSHYRNNQFWACRAALSDKEFVRSRAIGPENRSRDLRKAQLNLLAGSRCGTSTYGSGSSVRLGGLNRISPPLKAPHP